ncbi:MAG: hypothetical protein IJP72_05195 [Bacteroidales bacterium]|nr:hypothetical protein [Bacteroidales bacterium]
MKKNIVQISTAALKDGTDEYRFSIDFYVFPKDGKYVSYCPSLDLTTTGGNFNEAVGNFCECFQLYVECCVEAGTLWEDLKAHGWRLTKQEWHTPKIESLIKKTEVKELFNSPSGFEKVVLPARIPAFA